MIGKIKIADVTINTHLPHFYSHFEYIFDNCQLIFSFLPLHIIYSFHQLQ